MFLLKVKGKVSGYDCTSHVMKKEEARKRKSDFVRSRKRREATLQLARDEKNSAGIKISKKALFF